MKKFKVLVKVDGLKHEHRKIIVHNLGDIAEIYFNEKNAPLEEVDALMVFHWKGVISEVLLDKLKNLKVVQAITAGIDHIPEYIQEERGIEIHGAQGANSKYIAEHVFAFMLAAVKRICFHTQEMRNHRFRQDLYHGTLYEKKLALLGFGTIGQEVAKIAKHFDMEISVFKRWKLLDEEWNAVVKFVATDRDELHKILRHADFIVVALPLTRETRNLLSKEEFAVMKKKAVLVNVSRGKVIDEEALYNHLKENPEFVACLDTWWKYPKEEEEFRQDYPFEELPNVLMTPHIAAKIHGFFENMILTASKKLREYFWEVEHGGGQKS